MDKIKPAFEEGRKQGVEDYKKELIKKIEKLLPKHICRFNDEKCECECYKQAIEDVLKLLK